MITNGLAVGQQLEKEASFGSIAAGTPDWPSLVSPSMVSVFVGRRLTKTLPSPVECWKRTWIPKQPASLVNELFGRYVD